MPAVSSEMSLEAANALLPRLKSLVEAQMGRRGEIEQRLERLGKILGSVPENIRVEDGDSAEVRSLKRDLGRRLALYQSAWQEVEEMGAVVKDQRGGLIDFYGRVDGTLVWLCWKYGEDTITHYHGLDEGFSGRKPIESSMRHRHLN